MAKVMTRTILITLAASFLLLALSCGDEPVEIVAPGDVALESLAAYNNRDFDRVYDLASASLQEQMGSREEAIPLMEATWPPGSRISDLEVTEEVIEGDTAVVTWKGTVSSPGLPDKAGESSIQLVLEDGQWKIDSN